jgi:hypothetical protein
MQLTDQDFTAVRAIRNGQARQDEKTPPSVIVSFQNNSIKNQFRRSPTPSVTDLAEEHNLGNSENNNIYINDNLPPDTRQLFFHTREFKKTNDYLYAWTTDGQIYLRETGTSEIYNITSREQLKNLKNDLEERNKDDAKNDDGKRSPPKNGDIINPNQPCTCAKMGQTNCYKHYYGIAVHPRDVR